jgi:transcriptional regulator with XRE-family HTH domain
MSAHAAAPALRPADSGFGALLRHWRLARGHSQMELGLRAGVSTRHLSFIENGRAAASREMVLLLAQTLDVPLRERNALLAAGGYAAAYAETPLDGVQMQMLRRMLQAMIDHHEPYGAVVVDRCWNVILANRAIGRILGLFLEPEVLAAPLNHARLLLAPGGLRQHLRNWESVAAAMLARMQREVQATPSDAPKQALLEEVLAYPGMAAVLRSPESERAPAPFLPLHLAKDGLELQLFTAITSVGTPQDVTAQELRVETFFPADPATETLLQQGPGGA